MAPESASQARKRKRQEKIEKTLDSDIHQSKKLKSQENGIVTQQNSLAESANSSLEYGKATVVRGSRVLSLEEWEKIKKDKAAKRAARKAAKKEIKKDRLAKKSLEVQEPAKIGKEKKRGRKKSKQKSPSGEGLRGPEDDFMPNGITNGTDNNEQNRVSRLRSKQTKLLRQISSLDASEKVGTNISDEVQQLVERAERWVDRAGGPNNLAKGDEILKFIDLYSAKKQWRISEPAGGRWTDHDPVFSLDEEYLFLATSKAIHVYATATSLLVRTLAADAVSCYALSQSKSSRLYVGTSNGELHSFNWETGKLWKTVKSPENTPIQAMTVVKLPGTTFDTIISIEKDTSASAGDRLVVRRAPWDNSKETYQVLKHGHGSLHHLKVLDNGRAIFIAGDTDIFVGSIERWNEKSEKSSITLKDLTSKYRWSQLRSALTITTMDVHIRLISPNEERGHGRAIKRSYDFVVGNVKGELLVFQDIVEKLEKSSDSGVHKPQPRVLHWHREAVGSVKWSLDGNYLLSGGKETVLCIWQLETGKRQELPHLTAAINQLTVSPTGSSYAVRLSDNSVIVLSTTELEPKTHIAGIQSLHVASTSVNKHGLCEEAMHLYTKAPLASNPRNPTELLLAVPILQQVDESSKSLPSSPFLQRYDVSAARHISRQALTRNLVTEPSIDPDLNKIEVPNVTLLQVSNDGRWLATVEDWMPPSHSLDHLAYDAEEVEIERKKRRETYLKIWSWDEIKSTWSLNTRIDAPHRSETNETANRIFDLVAHPTRPALATIGEDSVVRIWLPRKSKHETSWTARSAVEIERNPISTDEGAEFPIPATPITGRLAYANDGSVLAVSQQDGRKNQTSVIQLLDPETGLIRLAESGLTAGYLLAMGFLSRYLIVLSKDLRVWDVVTSTLVFSKHVRHPHYLTLQASVATSHLAVDVKTETFALAGNGVCEESPESGVVLFSPTRAAPLMSFPLGDGAISALTSLATGGYAVLNSKAEIRTIFTKGAAVAAETGLVVQVPGAVEEEDDDDDDDEEDTAAGALWIVDTNREMNLTQDKRVINSDQLAKVFEAGASGYGLPSVKDMFDSVTGLFARKQR